MYKKKITIQINTNIPLDDQTIMLGENFIKKSKIPTNQNLTIRFGASKNQVKVVSLPRFDHMRISDSLARRIGLLNGARLILKYKARSQTLVAGPLLGVMINKVNSNSSDRPFGSITTFCKELTDACHLAGIYVFFFTTDDLSAGNQTIEGWSYYGGWRKTTFPIPDVVYNRLTSRILENKQSVQHFMREVKSQYNTKIFNEKFLNKTEVFQALKKDGSLHSYLPESHPLKSIQGLKSMCSRYRTIFLKPILGSLGKGIIRVTRSSNQMYICHFAGINGSRKQTFKTIPGVFSAVSSKMKVRRYQMQQGLNLISVGSRPMDFRALVQKNNQNQWEITSIVARIAGNHHFVSNLARGGTLLPVKEALQKSNLSIGSQGVSQRLRKAAIDISKGIDQQITQHFGELGVDLAVDTSGRVWLLEVNSKPSKNDNTPLSDNKVRPSVKQVTKYVRFLSGF